MGARQLKELDPQRIDFFERNVAIIGFCRSMGLSDRMDLQFTKLIQRYWYRDGIVTNKHTAYISVKYVYRYHSDGLNDFSWGCVYRNFQTLLSELNVPVPSIEECMHYMLHSNEATTATFNFDDFLPRSISKRSMWNGHRHLWIEPHDLASCINTKYSDYKLQCKLVIYDTRIGDRGHIDSILWKETRKNETVVYDESIADSDKVRKMIYLHLKKHKTPIIIDDGDYSYIIIGISSQDDGRSVDGCSGTEEVWYLIGDPHYGMSYGTRDVDVKWSEMGKKSTTENNLFDYGPDYGKIQWKLATFLEKCERTWMMLFVKKSN